MSSLGHRDMGLGFHTGGDLCGANSGAGRRNTERLTLCRQAAGWL